jgi:hypothetical protein
MRTPCPCVIVMIVVIVVVAVVVIALGCHQDHMARISPLGKSAVCRLVYAPRQEICGRTSPRGASAGQQPDPTES